MDFLGITVLIGYFMEDNGYCGYIIREIKNIIDVICVTYKIAAIVIVGVKLGFMGEEVEC